MLSVGGQAYRNQLQQFYENLMLSTSMFTNEI